jgi:hypothetical protein
MPLTPPRVLFVYYTYSQQTRRVVETMAAALSDRGCEVRQARIEFTEPRYAERFSRFPFRHPYLDILGMVPAQLRKATGQFRVPDEVKDGEHDLVVIGTPTWWLTTCMPIRSFMKSDEAKQLLAGKRFAVAVVCRRYWRNNLETVKALGIQHGGEYLDGIHFTAAGGQIESLLSLTSYLSTGENRKRYLGVPIPPANLKPDYREQARAFASGLADRLGWNART